MIGPREKSDAALSQLTVAARALQAAADCLLGVRGDLLPRRDAILAQRIEVARLVRELTEARDELTPLRPSSHTDLRAALDNAQAFPMPKGRAR